ncbi:MAG TPA: tetratricopeptide repeat protein [Acidobacteriaceae bacterium]
MVRLSIYLLGFALPIAALSEPVLAQESSSVPQSADVQSSVPSAPSDSVSTEVARAEEAMTKSDWKTAEPILQSWIAGHPSDARALFDAGYSADAQGRTADAISLYQRAVAANPQSFEAQISLGLLLARNGKGAEAKSALEAATRLDPGPVGPGAKARAWRALARIAMQADPVDASQASIDLIEALKLSPETPEDTLMAARLAEINSDNAGAESAYRRLLKARPDSPEGIAGLAHLLIAQKKYADAEAILEPAVKASPEDAPLTAQLAAVLVAEDKADALPLLEDFHTRHPKDATITRMLAQVDSDAGEAEKADALYTALLVASPHDAELLSDHGQQLIRLHRPTEAVRVFQSAAQADPSNGDAWNGLAFAAFQTHQPTVTLQALEARSKILAENPTTLFLWAATYDTLHDKKQAVAYYHRFLNEAAGRLPDQEWQARQRLALMEKTP